MYIYKYIYIYNIHIYTIQIYIHCGFMDLQAHVQYFQTHDKKPIGLRIKPTLVPMGTNSH